MLFDKKTWFILAKSAAMVLVLNQNSFAKVTPQEADKLKKELTPIGAERAGNAAGTIPAWEGGIKELPAGFVKDQFLNPFSADKALFTIDGQNFEKYKANLTAGQVALFKTFPKTYKMSVYPTRRSAAYPQWLYDETFQNATRASLNADGNGFSGTAKGVPFPIPKDARELFWNHISRYNTRGYRGYSNSAVTTPSGEYVVERTYYELTFRYNTPTATVDNLKNRYCFIFAKVVSPANKAGAAALLSVPLDRIKEQTGVWIFNQGQNRVRRVGEIGYDNPFPLADGLMTQDQVDMFNGAMDRYDFKLMGKKEIYVPYNDYEMYSPKRKYKDIIQVGHINQTLPRYELHRAWVIEANVKAGMRHIYKKRTFYLDEDSYLILLQDMYDERGQFWRTSESHPVNFFVLPLMANPLQVHYDLQSRRYVILNMANEERKPLEYDWFKDDGYFTPRQLEKFAVTQPSL